MSEYHFFPSSDFSSSIVLERGIWSSVHEVGTGPGIGKSFGGLVCAMFVEGGEENAKKGCAAASPNLHTWDFFSDYGPHRSCCTLKRMTFVESVDAACPHYDWGLNSTLELKRFFAVDLIIECIAGCHNPPEVEKG